MGRVHAEFGSADEPAFLIVSVYDMLAFSVPFALSVAGGIIPNSTGG